MRAKHVLLPPPAIIWTFPVYTWVILDEISAILIFLQSLHIINKTNLKSPPSLSSLLSKYIISSWQKVSSDLLCLLFVLFVRGIFVCADITLVPFAFTTLSFAVAWWRHSAAAAVVALTVARVAPPFCFTISFLAGFATDWLKNKEIEQSS